MSVCAFERRFWLQTDILYQTGGWLSAQHPPQKHKKLDAEFLPLLILAKHENGRRKNWDMTLEIKAKVNPEDEGEQSFDGEFRFTSNQPTISGTENREGRIEVVTGMTQEQFLAFKATNVQLERDHIVSQEPRDMDHGLPEMKSAVLQAISKKATKMDHGTYHKDTALLVWLRAEVNPRFGGVAFYDEAFKDQMKDAAGGFKKVCVVGINAGCHWVKGEGL